MTVSPGPIRVLHADRFHHGIVITFADGTSIVYSPEFLYKHRTTEGNRDITNEPVAAL
jgi:hypothetical protein